MQESALAARALTWVVRRMVVSAVLRTDSAQLRLAPALCGRIVRRCACVVRAPQCLTSLRNDGRNDGPNLSFASSAVPYERFAAHVGDAMGRGSTSVRVSM